MVDLARVQVTFSVLIFTLEAFGSNANEGKLSEIVGNATYQELR